MKVLWCLVGAAAGIAALVLFTTLAASKSAPQEAAGAAIALCIAVIPYVFTRAVEGVAAATWRERILEVVESASTNYKAGTESLFKQLDAIRAQTPAATPSVDATPKPKVVSGMGYCPGCKKLRAIESAKCVYCGDASPVGVV